MRKILLWVVELLKSIFWPTQPPQPELPIPAPEPSEPFPGQDGYIVPEKMMRTYLVRGDEGDAVKYLQKHLGVHQTGVFDALTEVEVINFQEGEGLLIDGQVGKQTWTALLDLPPLREEPIIKHAHLNLPDDEGWDDSAMSQAFVDYGGLIIRAGDRLGIHWAALLAVLMVESNGDAFGPDGRPIIRFENHIFWDYWGRHNPDVYNQHFRYATEPGDKRWYNHYLRRPEDPDWVKLHVGDLEYSQDWEWNALWYAMTWDRDSAIKSASFGLGQVIGFNAEQAGYDDLAEFMGDMNEEMLQIVAMIEFIRNGKTMLDALWELDFVKFAREYNGPGQPEVYGNKIKELYDSAPEYLKTGVK